jgi:ATP-dependent Zn protease
MEKLLRHLSTIILVFLIIVGLVILSQSPSKKPAEISLSELVTQINSGEIKQISVKLNELSIEKNDGTTEKIAPIAKARMVCQEKPVTYIRTTTTIATMPTVLYCRDK